MSMREARSGVAVVLLGALVAAAGPAAAQESPGSARAQARALYESGAAAFERGEFAAALRDLQESYRLFPSLRTLYSVGLCRQELFDYPGAVVSFREYLREGGTDVPENVRAEVDAAIAAMQRDMARLEIAVDVEGAEVVVDGRSRGTTPLSGLLEVGPGEHSIEVRREGYRTETGRVTVTAGGTATFRATLRREGPAAGRLVIESSGVAGEAFVDGRSVGPTPAVVEVPAGAHEVRVEAEGYRAGVRAVELAEGGGETVVFALEAVEAGGVGEGPGEPAGGSGGEPAVEEDTALWWLWTAIGVVVAGGAVTAGVLLWPEGMPDYDLRGSVP
ncbi:MAG: PEGA domain-containing protein [Myxococcota bacterium]|nr:PEGA domain-containing protein [Myxococcota bacterium]